MKEFGCVCCVHFVVVSLFVWSVGICDIWVIHNLGSILVALKSHFC